MNPFIFLIDILFSIYIYILLLRFLLQQVGADFYNPISQFIVKVTQKPVFIARRIIPSFRGIDLATLVLVFLFVGIKLFLISAFQGYSPSVIPLLFSSVIETVMLTIDVFIFCIFIQVILSWVNPDPYNPVIGILHSLTRPVLRPFQRMVPAIEGIDFSPMAALIALMFIKYSINYFLQAL